MIPSNFHTHTVYCDGKNTPEELVQEALRLGCREIGFSGHSYVAFDPVTCMSQSDTLAYKREILDLKRKYKGVIDIYLGVEQDYYSDSPTEDYEYVIGSVHAVLKDGVFLAVDESREKQIEAVERYYGGDWYAFIDDYYRTVADIYRKTKCTVIGHFDLVTKFNEGFALFDQNDPRYIASSDYALENLLDKPVVFEINTGAISRGYRTSPYPEERILRKIQDAGKSVIWTSDCHDKRFLLYGLPEDGRGDGYPCILFRNITA